MLNIFKKSGTLAVASLLTATAAFGQSNELTASAWRSKKVEPTSSCPPKPCCEEPAEMQLNPAYNASSRIEVRCPWDFYASGSFIYWEAMQDGMNYAATLRSTDTFNVGPNQITLFEVARQEYEYKPGFKVRAGMNFDHDYWDGYLEYTWFKGKTNSSVSAEDETVALPDSYVVSLHQQPNTYSVASSYTPFQTGSQEWKYSIQTLDAAMARSYYVGEQFTFRSFFGARFAWMNQKTLRTFFREDNTFGIVTGLTLTEKQNFSSWGAGLLGGADGCWMLGKGFRMIGNGSVDLLYTRVQTSNLKQSFLTSGETNTGLIEVQVPRPDFVMPHAALEFGFGWGSFFNCHNWHFDLLATYGFQVFWNANSLNQAFSAGTSVGVDEIYGNLYVHGLTTTLRLDF